MILQDRQILNEDLHVSERVSDQRAPVLVHARRQSDGIQFFKKKKKSARRLKSDLQSGAWFKTTNNKQKQATLTGRHHSHETAANI